MDIVDRLLQGRCDPGPTSDPHECELPSDECPCAIRADAAAEITRLRKERDEARAAITWRPIETAPKDGTHVFLYVPGDSLYPTVGHYDTREYFMKEYGDADYMDEGWRWSYGYPADFHDDALEPTRWMPLPTPEATK
jgi:hypothetical protein